MKVISESNCIILKIHVNTDTLEDYEKQANNLLDFISAIVDKNSKLSITDTLLQYQSKGKIK